MMTMISKIILLRLCYFCFLSVAFKTNCWCHIVSWYRHWTSFLASWGALSFLTITQFDTFFTFFLPLFRESENLSSWRTKGKHITVWLLLWEKNRDKSY
jgi:hypothetical protein